MNKLLCSAVLLWLNLKSHKILSKVKLFSIRRLGLGPIEKLLPFRSLVVKCENHLSCTICFVGVADYCLISWSNFSGFLYDDGVCAFSSRHKLGTIGDIPTYHSCLPNQCAFLKIQQLALKSHSCRQIKGVQCEINWHSDSVAYLSNREFNSVLGGWFDSILSCRVTSGKLIIALSAKAAILNRYLFWGDVSDFSPSKDTIPC